MKITSSLTEASLAEGDVSDRNATILRIKTALKKRSGKSWSVTGGQGTSWGWITIDVPPAQRQDPAARAAGQAELAKLLGLPSVHHQGVSIPAGGDYRREYLDRAEGRTPSKIAEPYWD